MCRGREGEGEEHINKNLVPRLTTTMCSTNKDQTTVASSVVPRSPLFFTLPFALTIMHESRVLPLHVVNTNTRRPGNKAR